ACQILRLLVEAKIVGILIEIPLLHWDDHNCILSGLKSLAEMGQENLSFVLDKAGSVRYEDRPVPKLKSSYDVIVNVKYTGICGSDVHYWVHGEIGHFVVKSPMVLGHESSGIVSEVGDGVTTVKKGDRVAMEPGIPCRRCVNCKSGKYNLCPEMAFAATPPFDGTLAKYYCLPEDFCYKLPQHISLEEGALLEPLSVGVDPSTRLKKSYSKASQIAAEYAVVE
ncbi:hypothetical protein AC579_7162, partial [Pseudocercospora musae]